MLDARHGFEVVSRVPDRFRVEAASLDDIVMKLNGPTSTQPTRPKGLDRRAVAADAAPVT